LTHDRRVARSCFDLLAVGERLLRGEAEINEVVDGRQRGNLTSCRSLLAILFEARGDNCRIKSYSTRENEFVVLGERK
jgi:hypothetical protein